MTGRQTLLRCPAVVMGLAAAGATAVWTATAPGEAEHSGWVAGGVGLIFAFLEWLRFRSKTRRTITVFTK